MQPTKEQVEGLLQTNVHWTTAPKDFEVQKIIVFRKIMKDLKELYDQDDDFATEVFAILRRGIATADWTAKCGVFAVWNSMLSRSKGLARKALTGKSDLENISQGLLKNGKKQNNKFNTRIQSSTAFNRG